MILLLLSKPSKHICLFEVAPVEGGFNCRRGKSPAVGRSNGGRHQASDEDHASFFSYRGRGRERSSFENTQCFYCQQYGHTIKFCRRKLKTRRRKNQASCTREKRRVRMILSFLHVVLKKLHMMKCDTSTVDVAII